MKKAVLACAIVTLFSTFAFAQLETGDKRFGMRLAYNYSYGHVPYLPWNDGGSGVEAGLHALFTFAHEVSIHTGVNAIVRVPISTYYSGTSFDMTEIAVSVPVVVHYNPFMLLRNRDSFEERFFLELGLQFDIPVLTTTGYWEFSDKFEDFDRAPVDIGAVIGGVLYLGGGIALDLRYSLSFTRIFNDKDLRSSYLNQGSLGLRFHFN